MKIAVYSNGRLACQMTGIVLIGLIHLAASSKVHGEEPVIEPGKSGPVSALLLPDKKVCLENEFLRFVFDPEDSGAASSIWFKLTGKELAICDTYGQRHFKAFRESLSIQRMREGRIDPLGRPYKLDRLEARDNQAVAQFSGFPYFAPANATGISKAMSMVRIIKTYTLRAGSSKLDISIQAKNESDDPLPIALWVMSGLRVNESDSSCFAPYSRGTMMRSDPWVKGASSFLIVSRPPEPWTGAVGDDEERTTICVRAGQGKVDAIYNWLAKFTGFTLGFGTPEMDVAPGKALSIKYSFQASSGHKRLDGASDFLTGGISLDREKVIAGQALGFDLSVASALKTESSIRVSLLKLTDGRARTVQEYQLSLSPGKALKKSGSITIPDEGTYVLSGDIKSSQGELHLERPLTVGLSTESYSLKRPSSAGRPFWSLRLEGKQPSWMRTCNRSVKHPMVPWNVPAADRKLKVLFIGNPGYTTGIFRDLARRADAEWDFVNLSRVQAAAYVTKDSTDEPYRVLEQKSVEQKLKEMNPNCVLTAGIQYANVEQFFLQALLNKVKEGMGLVMVGKPGASYDGLWPAIFKGHDFTETENDFMGPLRSLFEVGIAPGPIGEIETYSYGKGSIVWITKPFVYSAHSYSRNDLIPQIRGKTRLPDWEYHFAQYIKAMRSTNVVSAARIVDVKLRPDALELSYESDNERDATLVYDLISPNNIRFEHGARPIRLQAGRRKLSFKTKQRPGGEFILHAWLLESGADLDAGATSYIREEHPGEVIDFTARHCVLRRGVNVEQVTIDDSDRAVPKAIHVALSSLGEEGHEPLNIIAEIRNGSDSRVAWRDSKGWKPGRGRRVSFKGIRYMPVSPESVAVILVRSGGETLSMKSHRFSCRVTGDIAEDEMVFTTSTGVQADWYVTQIMRKWAVEEAGLNATFYDRGLIHLGLFGLGNASFPWRRIEGSQLSPPIVDERPFRNRISETLRKRYESVGTTYFCLQDEFRLGGEYDWSPETLSVFRKHLKRTYRKIKKLNTEWKTSYESFNEVMPLLLRAAKNQPESLGPWLDFRLYMDAYVTRRYEIANEEAGKLSPLIRVGESGMYTPSYDVGVNYFSVAQACPLMMSYSGLRAEWTQAFLKKDAIAGTWMGYGAQNPRHPWEAMFKGFHLLAWWGYMAKGLPHMAMVQPDLTIEGRFVEIGKQQAEIRQGIGKLFHHARLKAPRTLIPYSQASIYTSNAVGRDFVAATTQATNLLAKEGYPYSFVADEQAESGFLKSMKNKLFVFAGARSIPKRAADSYAMAIHRGCYALADADVAVRNGHGGRVRFGRLEDAFGIDRGRSERTGRQSTEPVTWSNEAPVEVRASKVEMACALKGIVIKTGTVWGTFPDGSPAVVAKESNSNSLAVWLNAEMEAPATKAAALPLLRFLVAGARIVPPVRFNPADFRPTLISEFEDGHIRYYGLLLSGRKGEATITLNQEAHTYDVRSGRYFGEVSTFNDAFDPATYAKIYAQLPYRVRGISTELTGHAKRGDVIEIRGKIRADRRVSEFHVIRCEVVEPGGNRPRYHILNVSAPRGLFKIRLPLAENATSGEWKIEFRDVISGVRKVLNFSVRQRVP